MVYSDKCKPQFFMFHVKYQTKQIVKYSLNERDYFHMLA